MDFYLNVGSCIYSIKSNFMSSRPQTLLRCPSSTHLQQAIYFTFIVLPQALLEISNDTVMLHRKQGLQKKKCGLSTVSDNQEGVLGGGTNI